MSGESSTVQTGPMRLLRSSSAKKINKSFDHKGPFHSLTLFLSFSPSLPLPLYVSLVSPPLTSIFSYFKNLSMCFFSQYSTKPSIFLSSRDCASSPTGRRTHSSDQPGADRQTETQTRASLFHKHGAVVRSRGTRHGKCLHHSVCSTKHERGGNAALRPLKHFLLSRIHKLPLLLSATVFSYAYVGPGVKGPLPSQLCCRL